MKDNKETKPETKKVFFITSNQSQLDNLIEYNYQKARGLNNFKAGEGKSEMKEIQIYKREKFSCFINSMEIVPKELKKEDQDEKSKRYKTELTLKYGGRSFKTSITFLSGINNFIYDLQFKEHKGWTDIYTPPPQINFSQLDQFKFYIRFLHSLKYKQGDQIYNDLITNSQKITLGKKIYLDFCLEIFKNCYTTKYVKPFLLSFKLENIVLPNEFNHKKYGFLDSIEKKPELIIKSMKKIKESKTNFDPKKDKSMLNFYTLLLFIRFKYDRDKAIKMLENKNLWDYFKKILPEKAKFFPKLEVPKELIDKMFEQDLKINLIIGILSFCGSVEKILVLINDKIELIANCCLKEKKELLMSSVGIPQKTDNLEKIIEEIKKINSYEINNNKVFIKFDEEFWKNYIQFNDDVNKLFMINSAIILCSQIDKALNDSNLNIVEKIHQVGLDGVKSGLLKNEELLNFICNDKYFSDNKYDNIKYKPLEIVNGLDFDNMTQNFFEQWNNSNIFKIYLFKQKDFKAKIIDKVTDMKNFGKLLKLFNYKDKKIFDTKLAGDLLKHFKIIFPTYKIETCPTFIDDVALFIYIIDSQNLLDIKDFLMGNKYEKEGLEKIIPSLETKKNIYIHLSKNYKDISKNVIEIITDFFTKNEEILSAQSILFLLGNINSKKIIESLMDKIERLIIKEEEIFNGEKEIESFVLLDGIQNKGLFDKLQEDLNKTQYLMNTQQIKEKFLEKVKKGEINYNSYKNNLIKEKKEILVEKLRILFFNNNQNVEECMNILEKKFTSTDKELGYIKRLKTILEEFYSKEHSDDIKKVIELDNLIKSGNLNEIEKPEIKQKLKEITNILSKEDFDKKDKLKESVIFLNLFRSKKNYNKDLLKESKIFENTEADFNKLKPLFERIDWYKYVDQEILKDCLKCFKREKNKTLKDELRILKNIFDIQNFRDNDLDTLGEGVKTFNQKEEIFLTVNSCMNFIDELEAEKTDFYKELSQIRNELKGNNILEQIEKSGKKLGDYGLNVLNPNEKDRDYLNILHCTYEKRGCIKFISKLKDEAIRSLRELVDMSDDTFLTNNEIQDMIKCSQFIHNLGEIKGKKNDQELIKAFIEEVPKMKGIEAHFQNYANNSGEIQELLIKKLDKSQATLQRIKEIMKKSIFTLAIINNKDPYLKFEGETSSEDKQGINITLNYEDLIELRERAMLTRKLGDDKSQEEKMIFNLYRLFSERVGEIEKINQLLKKLGEKGYSEDIKIVIDIKDNIPSFSIDKKMIEKYKDCSEYLDELYSKINEIQSKYYKNEELIRYIYGRQFNLLNSCLRKGQYNVLVPFLKFLTNDKVESNKKLQELKYDYDYKLNEDENICLFENIKKFLFYFLKNNNLKLEYIYEQNLIKEEYRTEFVGLYTYLLEDDKIGEVQKGLEEHMLNWFKFLTGNPPMAQTVLLCNEETTSEEITAFMYRAFLCQYPVFFMIGKIELLTPEKRQTLTRLVNILFRQRDKEMKSCIAFGYSIKDDSLVRYLENLKDHKLLKHNDKQKVGKILYNENVEIISSDKPGVGKSTQIKLNIEAQKKDYIYFPFGGEFSRKDVINRLKKIQNKIKSEENTVIHLDLYDSKQTELMKDFLYSFLITKLYGQNENLFYLSKKVKIIIEIPCGFIDFFNKYPLLSMFEKRTEITIKNLPPLIIQKELNSNIQIVCNYLKLLKSGKIAEKDLIINEVSLSKEDIYSTIAENIKIEDTTIDAVSLDAKECETLIKDLIKNKLKIEYPTYYQINSFINVLSGQLKKFSMNYSLTAAKLIEGGIILQDKNFKNLRKIMVNSFIHNTIHFTQGAFEKILTAQQETYKIKIEHGNYDENKQEEAAVKALSQPGDIISYNKIDPALVFFHEGEGQDFSIITNKNTDKEEYNNLLNLRKMFPQFQNALNKQLGINKREPVPKALKQYTEFTQEQFLEEIKQILSINNPVKKEDAAKLNHEDRKLKSIEEIVGEYAFTADNFIKMVLILLRIRENIPVIMMGETGCGKTSLIRKLSELINNGEKKMEILNIHAGISDDEIVKFLFEPKIIDEIEYPSIVKQAQNLEEKEERIRQKYLAEGQKYFKKKLWVFLDEINTCNCMGLICEMMTKHTCQGEKIPENIFFIGACNPYRYGKKGMDNYALKIKDAKEKNLVYTVNPLPFSLLNFVFNFGNLTPVDEKRYIDNMVISPIEKFFIKGAKEENKQDKDPKKKNKFKSAEDENICKELIKLASDAINQAQNYVRDKNDVSSVSLREIRRFSIFYEFFVDYFRKNKEHFQNRDEKEILEIKDIYYKNLGKEDIYRHSIKLSIYLCYYMRLTNKDFRNEFAQKMSKLFGDNFIEIPEKEQRYIAENIEVKPGIAKNRALLENLFTLFACINAKVPLFIVGKPGCSKSLSVQLLFNAMKGDSSDNILFKSLPKLFINSFQGSLGSTSKGVINIFKKARNLLKNNDNNLNKIISMIFFDEMGLAEHSPNNPLKVIHSELEYDLNEGAKKIAFVGISNWILDASKMNRGLFLSIPPSEKQDLELTALTIAKSYHENLAQDNRDLFIALADTYYEYKETLQKKYTIKEDFHGSRDFYHLIKTAMRLLLKKLREDSDLNIDENVKQEIGINSIERNFAGLEFKKGSEDSITSLEIIKEIFKKRFVNCDVRKKYNVIKIICDNIKDEDSRYLLLVAKSSISNYLLNSILTSTDLKNDLNKELSYYIGSGFTKDIHSEGYGLKILNKIQLQMEQNKILLLSDLEAVYPSLYDLFNQNFTVVSNKNYARIAMGSTNNTFSLVNEGFKCIVLVDERALDKAMPPFLNRFEKHIISFEYLLSEEYIKEAENIYKIIQDFSEIHSRESKIDIKFNQKNLLLNCDKEEIRGIIYSKYSECKKNKKKLLVQDLQDFVLEKIALTLPQDIILLIKNSGFDQKYPKLADKIIDFYLKGVHTNLLNFLKTMKNTKNVIYTFSSIDEPLLANVLGEFETELLGKIDRNNIKEIQISALTAENELEQQIEQIYISHGNKIKIIVLKFNPYETAIMNYIKFFIENYLKEKNYIDENNKKVYIFSVHMIRIFKEDEDDPKKKGYIKKNILRETISHLSDFDQIFIDNLDGPDFSIIDMMKLKSDELFTKCLKLDKEFIKNIYEIFSYFNHNFNINLKCLDKINYPNKILNFLENNKDLSQLIINCNLNKSNKNIDIAEVLKKKEFFSRDDISIVSVVQKYISYCFADNLTKLIFKLEKDNFLSTLIFNQILNENANNQQELCLNDIKEDEKKEEIVEENKIEGEKEQEKEIEEEKEEEIVLNKEKKVENEKKEEKNEINENKEEFEAEKEEKKEDKNYYLNNNFIKILIETYLDRIDFSENKVKKNLRNNKVSLLLGLRIPGIYPILKDIIKYIKSEIKTRFLLAERNIIILRENEEKYLNRYQKRVESLQNNAKIEILKHYVFEKLNDLENQYQNDSNKFYDLLMEDYYLIYLSENLSEIKDFFNNLDDYKNILKLMLHQRFSLGDKGEVIDSIQKIANKMVWMESYSQYICILLNIYKKLSLYQKDIFTKIDTLIKSEEIKLEDDEKLNPSHTKEIKSPFFCVTDALLRIAIDKQFFNQLNEQEFYDFINLLKTINKDSLIINEDLDIYSKEIFAVLEFLEIEESLSNVGKSNMENIITVLDILLNISNVNNKVLDLTERGNDLSTYIIQLYDFLYTNLGDTENFRELIMGIFLNELKKVKNDDYKTTLVDIILNNKNLIVYSSQFMSIIMERFLSNDPADISDNINNLKEAKQPWLKKINNENNDILNEILLIIFEKVINVYFDKIPLLKDDSQKDFKIYFEYKKKNDGKINKTYILSDKSLDIFIDCINLLETIYNDKREGKKEINNDLICELYAIAYIKIYMFKYIHFSHYNNQEFIDYQGILKAIKGNAKTEVRTMIKIYAFKVFYFILKNYHEFSNYNYINHQITFFDDLRERFRDNKEVMLNFYMLPNAKDDNKFKIFKEYLMKFDDYKYAEFNKPISEFVNFIVNNGIDYFYMISTDLYVSNLALKNYTKNSNEYTKYSSFTKNLFNDKKIKISETAKQLFFLYSNEDVFEKTMKKKFTQEQNMEDIDVDQFEILLYALRICLQTTNIENPKGFLYSQIISPDCQKTLESNCFPGNNLSSDYKVKNYALLEKHLNTRKSNYGAYVCGCGYFYYLEPCGFPARGDVSGICPHCFKKIGSGKHPPGIQGFHGFAHEEGHFRIFKDQKQKETEFQKFTVAKGYNPPDTDESIPNMLLADYKKKIDAILENEKYGISKVEQIFFLDTNQKIRNLSQVGYRILNFILYSHLFYANCLGFISNEDMQKNICDGMTCIQMLEKDFSLLKEALQSKGIQIVQIFLNLIFDKLSEKIKNCKEIKTIKEREIFEDEIEKLLEESYKEYGSYAEIYKKYNEELLKLDKYSMKSLVLEINDINSYDEKDYPFYKYFMMTTYPTKEGFTKELKKIPEYERKYPLISNYLRGDNPEKFLIKYLPEFNEFSNFMIDYYSYKISRDDALNRKMEDEDIYKNKLHKFDKKFESFKKKWPKLKPYATKYTCRDEMPQIDLDEKQPLAYFLNDNGDIGKGMYIAAAYEKFIGWQNNFLDSIIEPSRQNGILHHFVKNMEKTIDVQNAKKNEALNFDLINQEFNLYIYENCKRNIFRKDNSINYMNYKQFLYDYDTLEKLLGDILLPGKVKFNSAEKLRFVTYCFEGFRGDKSSLLSDFAQKYKQKELSQENKQKIYDIIKDQLVKKKEELANILFSIQLLIYYLTQERKDEKQEIRIIIGDLPDYVTLTKEGKEFLENEKLNMKLEDLIGIYSFFELLCFEPIVNNLQAHYKKEIDEKKKENILNLISEKKFQKIDEKTLSSACRKFISRYLVSSRKDTDFNEDNDLSVNLTRYEFWPPDFFDDEEALNRDLNYLKTEKLTIGQCYELYKLLGGDEKDELEGIEVKQIEDNDENENENSDDEDIGYIRIQHKY